MHRVRSTLVTSSQRLRRFHSAATRASTSTRAPYLNSGRSAATLVATTAAAALLWHLSGDPVHNDAPYSALPPKASPAQAKPPNSTGVDEDGVLCAVVWGSNKSKLIDPQSPGIETFQTPANARWLENVALRDLALHEKHAACVDARGDVFQWGEGFFGSESDNQTPKATLCGKNIVKVQLTDSRVYALSATGRVYVFAANEARQKQPTQRTASSSSWWGSGWLGREDQKVDFMEVLPREKLNWGETFVSIAAGSNHLLVLTSEGRTYAHPVNKDANSHGQLGLQKIEIPAPRSSGDTVDQSRTTVELVPRSTVGSNGKATSSSQEPTSLTVEAEHPDRTNDRQIGYSDTLFEIPSLKGVRVSQITAGGRSSFVNTRSGRVLGWGANEHGQVGLGSGITLDTITVPTEVDLTRYISPSTQSRCLNVIAGGDLTCFVAERNARESHTYIDILCCGNGQWGGLGNNSFSTFQGSPVRVRNVSGLHEFNDREQRLSPIVPQAISISPMGHVLLSLDTQSHAGPGGSGRDLVVWGLNHDYQLGTGKKSSLNTPMALERPEGGRFILTKRRGAVRDLSGNLWKKNVEVEQCAVAGYGNSVVYWRTKP